MKAPARASFVIRTGYLRSCAWRSISSRWALALLFWLFAASLLAASPASRNDIQRAQSLAVKFLIANQSADGAWRSRKYGVLKHGPELTPVACQALQRRGGSSPGADEAGFKAVRFLAELVGPDGLVRGGEWGFRYPVYTSAAAIEVLAGDDRQAGAKRASESLLAFLRGYRFNGELGWRPGDATFGGWGFSPLPIRRSDQPEMANDGANLTATLFGLAALRSTGVKSDSAEIGEIRDFVFRCQNFAARPAARDRNLDDGGFFFSPVDTLRNKAGGAGDAAGNPRYYSYGSCTADGLRALALCGLPPDHPRVGAATRWLEQRFAVDAQPGRFAQDREIFRAAYYYYYAWSLAHALETLTRWNVSPGKQRQRAAELAAELIRRQAADGSWRNIASDGKEDDPLVATPLALDALNVCRRLTNR